MALENLNIKKIQCFGWSTPLAKNWTTIASSSISKGWNGIDKKALESTLAADTEKSYKRLFESEFEDLDDSIHYTVWFDNAKKLFCLELTNGKDNGAEILPEQKRDFFKSSMFKKTAKRAYELIERAKKIYEGQVKQHLEEGDLLECDETKLEAIESFLNDEQLMRNFRLAKWAK